MSTRILIMLAAALPILSACQKSDDTTLQGRQTLSSTGTTSTSGSVSRPRLIMMADGTQASLDCLGSNADAMEAAGSDSARMAIAKKCDVRALHAESGGRGTYGDYSSYYVPGYTYAAYYDPRSYCNNKNYNGYYFNTLFNRNYNFNWMGALGYSGYNYYSYNQYPQYYTYSYNSSANNCIYYGGSGCNNRYFYYTYLY